MFSSVARVTSRRLAAGRSIPSAVATTQFGVRFFSDGSHDDFAPKRKPVADEDQAIKMIDDHVKSNPVMLYMKGNPSMPMCGFSSTVVQILKKEGVDFSSVNVLDYPQIREGVKKYSEWPTIPQLYVNGEFIGGCDIITQMHENGELKEVFEEVGSGEKEQSK
uniref:Glutaredoxin domain-containing protein n=1 Tax=Craspedostauros australis TaxID=1486917 RepID=A0A7R9ZLC7_9STRA|mmetsp:Transcript_13921/g.38255  ORF Transcript_13921/g.38255 Transcript_13921/m.38255 type:complete len:163 (+) Transcript_13921:151-639(+)